MGDVGRGVWEGFENGVGGESGRWGGGGTFLLGGGAGEMMVVVMVAVSEINTLNDQDLYCHVGCHAGYTKIESWR